MKKYPTCKKIVRYIRNVLIIFILLSITLTVVFRFAPSWITPLMLIRKVEMMDIDKDFTITRKWVPIERISPHVINAVITSEDPKFLNHWGFDFEAIEKAMETNKKGNVTIGASSISQQTAKNLFLWPERSWLRKILEAYFTLLIELFWSKERIIEIYLNIIETGDGLFGIEAASNEYFDKPASDLSKDEAAMIAAILPNPRKWKPDKSELRVYKRYRWILWHMEQRGEVRFQ